MATLMPGCPNASGRQISARCERIAPTGVTATILLTLLGRGDGSQGEEARRAGSSYDLLEELGDGRGRVGEVGRLDVRAAA